MASSRNYAAFIFYLVTISNLFSMSYQAFSQEVSEIIAEKLIEKTTHLHFFFQDILSGKNPTAMRVITTENLNGFGDTYMIDDALTEGADRTSKIIGRAEGMYSVAGQNDFALLMVVCFEFTEGKYNGSSISLLGRNHIMDDVREMPIIGGSGLFRFARGYALAHTVWFDNAGDATVEYNVYVQHY